MNEPQYYKIYKHIINRINSGELKDGSILETEMELTRLFSVSRVTVRKAMELLVTDGFLSRKRGKGSVVTLNNNSQKDSVLPGHFSGKSTTALGDQQVIGFILPGFSSSFGMRILEGIEIEAERHGYYLVMKLTKGDQKLEEKAIRDLISLGVAGLIIFPQHGEFYNPVIMELVLKEFPFVLIDRELRGLKSSFIGTDNKAASFEAITYLIGKGHKNILYLSPPVRNTSALEDRLEGARAAFDSRNIPILESRFLTDFQSTLPGNRRLDKWESDKKILIDYFTGEKGITAIFACEYGLAVLASIVLKELNLTIPKDVSVLCFDSPADYLGQYDFTHLEQNEYEMGVSAVDMLNQTIKGEIGIEKKVLPVKLIKGTSVTIISPIVSYK